MASVNPFALAVSLFLTGRKQECWDLVRQEQCWTSHLAAAAPCEGYDLWSDGMRCRATRLAAAGHLHWAVCHLLALGDIWQAVQLYMRHGLHREALALARCRLDPERDPAFRQLLTQLLAAQRQQQTVVALKATGQPQAEEAVPLQLPQPLQEMALVKPVLRQHEHPHTAITPAPDIDTSLESTVTCTGAQAVAAAAAPVISTEEMGAQLTAAAIAPSVGGASGAVIAPGTGPLEGAVGSPNADVPQPPDTSRASVAAGPTASTAITPVVPAATVPATTASATSVTATVVSRSVSSESLALQCLLAGSPLHAVEALRGAGSASALATGALMCARLVAAGSTAPDMQQGRELVQIGRSCATDTLSALLRELVEYLSGTSTTTTTNNGNSKGNSSGVSVVTATGHATLPTTAPAAARLATCARVRAAAAAWGDASAAATHCIATLLEHCWRELLGCCGDSGGGGEGRGDGVGGAAGSLAASRQIEIGQQHGATCAPRVDSGDRGSSRVAAAITTAAVSNQLDDADAVNDDTRYGARTGIANGESSCGGNINYKGVDKYNNESYNAKVDYDDDANDDEDDALALMAVSAVYLGGRAVGGAAARRKVTASRRRAAPATSATAPAQSAGTVTPPTSGLTSTQQQPPLPVGGRSSAQHMAPSSSVISCDLDLKSSSRGDVSTSDVVAVRALAERVAPGAWMTACRACGVAAADGAVTRTALAALQAAAEAATASVAFPAVRSGGDGGSGDTDKQQEQQQGVASAPKQSATKRGGGKRTVQETAAVAAAAVAFVQALCGLATAAATTTTSSAAAIALPSPEPLTSSPRELLFDAAMQLVVAAERCVVRGTPLPPPMVTMTTTTARVREAPPQDQPPRQQVPASAHPWAPSTHGQSAAMALEAAASKASGKGAGRVKHRLVASKDSSGAPVAAASAAGTGASKKRGTSATVADMGGVNVVAADPASPYYILYRLQQQDMEVSERPAVSESHAGRETSPGGDVLLPSASATTPTDTSAPSSVGHSGVLSSEGTGGGGGGSGGGEDDGKSVGADSGGGTRVLRYDTEQLLQLRRRQLLLRGPLRGDAAVAARLGALPAEIWIGEGWRC